MTVKVKSVSPVRLFASPWTVAYQAPPSMGFSRQECWSGLPFPSLGDLPDPGNNPGVLHCRQTLYRLSHQGSPRFKQIYSDIHIIMVSYEAFYYVKILCAWPIYTSPPTNLAAATAAAKSLQSCPTLCDPIDGSPPGSPVPGILQARTLEWVAISFSNAWKWKVKVKLLSHAGLLATLWTAAYQAPPSMGFSRQEYWSGVPLGNHQFFFFCVIHIFAFFRM